MKHLRKKIKALFSQRTFYFSMALLFSTSCSANAAKDSCEGIQLFAQYNRSTLVGEEFVNRMSDPEAFKLPLSKDGPLLSHLLVKSKDERKEVIVHSHDKDGKEVTKTVLLEKSKTQKDYYELKDFNARSAIEDLTLKTSLILEFKNSDSKEPCKFTIGYGEGH